jgi:hypothetical protein
MQRAEAVPLTGGEVRELAWIKALAGSDPPHHALVVRHNVEGVSSSAVAAHPGRWRPQLAWPTVASS